MKKNNKCKIADLWKHSENGTIPQPNEGEWETIRLTWEIRLKLSLLDGTTLDEVEARAKAEYEGRSDGTKTWDRDCEPWRKYAYVSALLPRMEAFEGLSGTMYQFRAEQ
jgi:hypothetical protein